MAGADRRQPRRARRLSDRGPGRARGAVRGRRAGVSHHADGRRRRPARPGRQRHCRRPGDRSCGSAWSSTRRGRCRGDAVGVGARRSPVSTPDALAALARTVVARPGFTLVGPDGATRGRSPASATPVAARGPIGVRAMQRRSRVELAERRAAAVAAVRAVAPLEFVNGGGTGSLESTSAEPAVTEVTAGSGLFGSALFDHYRAWRPQPAAFFALPVVRRPGPGAVTVLGGGWIASGPAGRDRLPVPWLPTGLRLDGTRRRRRGADAVAWRRSRPAGDRRPRVVPACQGRRAERARQRVARRRRRPDRRTSSRPTAARAKRSSE